MAEVPRLFQRPITFRVWRNGQMRYNCSGLPIGMSEDALLLQFTGLYDKNGAEIYEGDVILIDEQWAKDTGSGRTRCVVAFQQGAFMYGRSDVDPYHMNTNLWSKAKGLDSMGREVWRGYCIVIGNVFETPNWDAEVTQVAPS